jgi:DNA-binding NarL/FixJ family response regulator
MAVLSEPIDDTSAISAPPCVVVGTGERTRAIAAALAVEPHGGQLREVESVEMLAALGVDADTIVIFACDVDSPSEMATLRRLHREVREPAILTVLPTVTATGVRRALDAGADAIVFEHELEQTLAVAVTAVGSGQSVVPRKMRTSVERPAFSHRERQVLTFVSEGLTNAQIAERLFLSESTIKSHLSSAFAKFGVRSRREAAALFLELEKSTRVAV